MGLIPNEYALYKGDTFLMIGTYKEIAEYLGVKVESVKNYTCSRYKKMGGNNHYIFVNLGPAWKKKGTQKKRGL
ncbi:MAG: hypothetical protein J6S85_20395 [Methanobrevibacter sp.]|nr:hypothetical protein [Methanobrevibacter sp.]